ncbi:MAG: hypothetical protein ACJAY7_000836 [Pseudohongiellaceae bacterium]|jgi:hypothetical protein
MLSYSRSGVILVLGLRFERCLERIIKNKLYVIPPAVILAGGGIRQLA